MGFKKNFIKKKHYDYIISLGYNCEVTYKFLRHYGFEESNLFNWVHSGPIENLTKALMSFSDIGAGDWRRPGTLWTCLNSNIHFHGKVPIIRYVNNTISEEEIEADKEDLISRVKYLKEKFLTIAKDEKKKLYIYKIDSHDVDDLVDSKIISLLNALKDLGVNNFDLLVVAEKSTAKLFKKHSDKYDVDFVKYFPPDDDVTNEKYLKNGWSNVFNRFSVAKSKKYNRKKKYKFELNNDVQNNEYDLIFSLGEACSCATALKDANLRLASYPFDWMFGSDFLNRCKMLASKFERFIEKEDLEFSFEARSIKCNAYYNNYNNIVFNHDFLKDLPFDEAYKLVREKYDRRIQRLLNDIEKSKRVLVLYIETPVKDHILVEDKIILDGFNILREKFGNKIELLYVKNSTVEDVTNLTDGITVITCDYKDYSSDLDYNVNLRVLKNVLKPYKMRLPMFYKIKRVLLKFLINFVPIKAKRRELRKRYHF